MVSSFVKTSQQHMHLQNVTVQAVHIELERFVANAKTVGPGGKRQSILYNIRHEKMLIHVPSARLFVFSLYGIKARNCSSLDQMRYLLASTTDKPASHLTPREDAFKQHVFRARYQINI